jgi:hypothetical protein
MSTGLEVMTGRLRERPLWGTSARSRRGPIDLGLQIIVAVLHTGRGRVSDVDGGITPSPPGREDRNLGQVKAKPLGGRLRRVLTWPKTPNRT